jgi:CheY-like chemotaxis protein
MPAAPREALGTAKRAAEDVLRLTNDLLDSCRITAGKLELERTAFSLRGVVADCVQTLASLAHRKGLQVLCDVPSEVPDRLIGDPGRLRQILLNILGNAVKFTERGQVSVHVAGAASARDRERVDLAFTVRDTGIGIALEQQDRVFRPFEQASTSIARLYGGSGLGLSIAAQLVALMGGTIEMRSAPGEGSVFAFSATFGLNRAWREAHASSRAQRQRGTVAPDAARDGSCARGSRVLVVEDDEFSVQFLTHVLSRSGYDVTVAKTGAEGLQLACEEAFDAMVLDIHLPERNGFEITQVIRSRESALGVHLPVVALTARSRREDRARCMGAGMDDFLSKPVRPAELLSTIGKLVRRGPAPARRHVP